MKEKVTFTLTETTKQALLNACKGTYLAQARAVWEGYLVDASFRKIAAAIRDVYAAANRKQTCGNQAIQGGLVAARLTAANGETLTEEARIENIANGMRAAANEHAAKEAERREAKKKEKAAEQAKEQAAAKEPLSVQLKAKRDMLMAIIEESQKKVAVLNGEIEAAEQAEAKQAAEQAAEQKKRDDEILASAQAILASRGVTLETTPLLHAVNEVEMENAIEARREARRARKANKVAIPA